MNDFRVFFWHIYLCEIVIHMEIQVTCIFHPPLLSQVMLGSRVRNVMTLCVPSRTLEHGSCHAEAGLFLEVGHVELEWLVNINFFHVTNQMKRRNSVDATQK